MPYMTALPDNCILCRMDLHVIKLILLPTTLLHVLEY